MNIKNKKLNKIKEKAVKLKKGENQKGVFKF